jgi:ubiquinone/menaquinone biosynthesis C-methylase UbiE
METGDLESDHRRRVVDQFTRQAVAFSRMPSQSEEVLTAAAAAGPDADVLDVACGPGLTACMFATSARRVTGIDITPAMITQARRLQTDRGLQNLRWVVGDVAALPFPDAGFDVVFTRYSLHHLTRPRAVVSEMRRVCAAGGRIVVVDMFAMTPAQGEALDSFERLRDPSHVRALGLEELTSLFERAGLERPQANFYRHEVPLDALMAGSFPNPGDADKLAAMVLHDVGVDRLGLDARHKEGRVSVAYPIVVLSASRTRGVSPPSSRPAAPC